MTVWLCLCDSDCEAVSAMDRTAAMLKGMSLHVSSDQGVD